MVLTSIDTARQKPPSNTLMLRFVRTAHQRPSNRQQLRFYVFPPKFKSLHSTNSRSARVMSDPNRNYCSDARGAEVLRVCEPDREDIDEWSQDCCPKKGSERVI
jgi:hypothetical protein